MFGRNDGSDDSQKNADETWQHPGQPIEPAHPTPAEPLTPAEPPTSSAPMITLPPASTADAASTPSTPSPAASTDDSVAPTPAKVLHDNDTAADTSKNDLIDIKQKALTQLNPLMDHLDQTPEEKFRTTMMMIQASDDQKLVAVAYEAAQKITDEKARAQALLDIVNEINYFTQHHTG